MVCVHVGVGVTGRTCPLALDAVAVGGGVVEHDLAKEAHGEGAAKHKAFWKGGLRAKWGAVGSDGMLLRRHGWGNSKAVSVQLFE